MTLAEAPQAALASSWTQRHDAAALERVLAELREHGRLSLACEMAGVGMRSVQRLRVRDDSFRVAVADAYRAFLAARASGKNRHRYRRHNRRGPGPR